MTRDDAVERLRRYLTHHLAHMDEHAAEFGHHAALLADDVAFAGVVKAVTASLDRSKADVSAALDALGGPIGAAAGGQHHHDHRHGDLVHSHPHDHDDPHHHHDH